VYVVIMTRSHFDAVMDAGISVKSTLLFDLDSQLPTA
jgi:hypothetical protein